MRKIKVLAILGLVFASPVHAGLVSFNVNCKVKGAYLLIERNTATVEKGYSDGINMWQPDPGAPLVIRGVEVDESEAGTISFRDKAGRLDLRLDTKTLRDNPAPFAPKLINGYVRLTDVSHPLDQKVTKCEIHPELLRGH